MSIRKLLFLIAPFTFAVFITGCSSFFYEPARPVRTVVHTPPPIQISEVAVQQAPEPQPAQQPTPRRKPNRTPRRQQQVLPAISSDFAAADNQHHGARELASHETTFDTKEKNRGTNIARAAESISNKIVKPGETFSFNETIGPTIKRHGYKKAMVYKNGEKSEGEGGGVCQVSSTLHMAAVKAGMTIIERHDHSLPVTYAQSGEEAAVSYGVQDFKFKNDKHHPVQIKSHVNDGKIKVVIYSVP